VGLSSSPLARVRTARSREGSCHPVAPGTAVIIRARRTRARRTRAGCSRAGRNRSPAGPATGVAVAAGRRPARPACLRKRPAASSRTGPRRAERAVAGGQQAGGRVTRPGRLPGTRRVTPAPNIRPRRLIRAIRRHHPRITQEVTNTRAICPFMAIKAYRPSGLISIATPPRKPIPAPGNGMTCFPRPPTGTPSPRPRPRNPSPMALGAAISVHGGGKTPASLTDCQ
jgi:hypothetical protein